MRYLKCSYQECDNTSYDISMFRFPMRDPGRLLEWIQNSGSPRLKTSSMDEIRKQFMCAAHFHPASIYHGSTRKKLIGLAVPIPYTRQEMKEESSPMFKNTLRVYERRPKTKSSDDHASGTNPPYCKISKMETDTAAVNKIPHFYVCDLPTGGDSSESLLIEPKKEIDDDNNILTDEQIIDTELFSVDMVGPKQEPDDNTTPHDEQTIDTAQLSVDMVVPKQEPDDNTTPHDEQIIDTAQLSVDMVVPKQEPDDNTTPLDEQTIDTEQLSVDMVVPKQETDDNTTPHDEQTIDTKQLRVDMVVPKQEPADNTTPNEETIDTVHTVIVDNGGQYFTDTKQEIIDIVEKNTNKQETAAAPNQLPHYCIKKIDTASGPSQHLVLEPKEEPGDENTTLIDEQTIDTEQLNLDKAGHYKMVPKKNSVVTVKKKNIVKIRYSSANFENVFF